MFGPFAHMPRPFNWKLRAARKLRRMGLDGHADELMGISEEKTRQEHDEEARKARLRASRKTPFGKLLNILGF